MRNVKLVRRRRRQPRFWPSSSMRSRARDQRRPRPVEGLCVRGQARPTLSRQEEVRRLHEGQ
jgi:hypothetical protein